MGPVEGPGPARLRGRIRGRNRVRSRGQFRVHLRVQDRPWRVPWGTPGLTPQTPPFSVPPYIPREMAQVPIPYWVPKSRPRLNGYIRENGPIGHFGDIGPNPGFPGSRVGSWGGPG